MSSLHGVSTVVGDGDEDEANAGGGEFDDSMDGTRLITEHRTTAGSGAVESSDLSCVVVDKLMS